MKFLYIRCTTYRTARTTAACSSDMGGRASTTGADVAGLLMASPSSCTSACAFIPPATLAERAAAAFAGLTVEARDTEGAYLCLRETGRRQGSVAACIEGAAAVVGVSRQVMFTMANGQKTCFRVLVLPGARLSVGRGSVPAEATGRR